MTNVEIKAGVRLIARLGYTNMFARQNVIEIAKSLGNDKLARWIEENQTAYGNLILTGKLPDDEDGNETDAEYE
ncbi:MAG: DUF5049 domain-containing protein [Oscillospiraceae bacterium]|jgi:hypothetical protein|nr:DUF5049 domain-containing protein [Oscillospiraceae bacterium]